MAGTVREVPDEPWAGIPGVLPCPSSGPLPDPCVWGEPGSSFAKFVSSPQTELQLGPVISFRLMDEGLRRQDAAAVCHKRDDREGASRARAGRRMRGEAGYYRGDG